MNDSPVMTVEEVAAYLRIGEGSVYRLVKCGVLPGKKVGGVWRFHQQEIEDYLRETNAAPPSGTGMMKNS